MEGELHQSQTGPGEANSGTSLTPTTQPTPNPPRLTPNPTLLDSPPPTLTPASNSPPPPLTPAPSLSASHAPKSPHAPIPAPPKLTSTPSAHNPALRTYSRPILPSPVGQRSKTPSSPTAQPSSFPLPTSTSSSSPSAASPAPLSVSSSSFPSSHNNANVSAKISCPLTNGNTKPVFTATSTPVTPFHTPASPTSKQVSQTTPPGIPGLVRVNQGSSPVVRQGVSQQTLLLGKGLKGSGQDQVLLRAQMLQSLTLRPPPPGTLTIRPSLRLSGPLSAPPALSRPRTPLFPPLRPRPQPGAAATEGPTMPTRHLSVAPPALYSPVRAVPLRPRLRSPNGYRAPPPRQNSTLQPTTAASATYNPPLSKLTGSNACSLSEPSQSQQSSIAVSNHMAALSHFDRSPSAARQLQIIALSSGRQSQSGSGHAAVQSAAPVVVSPSRSPLGALSGGEAPAPPLKLSSPKTTTTSMPSPPSLFPPRSPLPPPASPAGQTGSQAHAQPAAATQRGSIPCRARENEERAQGLLHGQRRPAGEEGGSGKDPVPERDNQRESEKVKRETKRENPVVQEEEGLPRRPKEPRLEVMDADEGMEVAEGEGQRVSVEKREGEMEIKEGTSADPAENHSSKTRLRGQNLETNPKTKQDPVLIQNSSPEPKPILDPVPPPVAAPAPVPVPVPVPQLPAHTQRLLEPQRDIQPMSSEDICESMSTQSDNQSALSSLSSQSPPTSPTLAIPSDMPVPLLCAQPTLPEHLSLAQGGAERASQLQEAEAEAERPEQSEENEEGEPWMPKVWPEGRQVLTHLVEGFVIKEGLQPFPVNRSSLLVQEPVNPPPEVNGTNGKEAFPVTDTLQPTEQSTDSEEEEGGATDDQTTRPSQRDKAVLHCQFCGKRGHAHSFMRSKRFCSTSCARGFNVRLTKRLRALSAGSRSDRSRPTLNRASSVPGKPLLLRLPRDLWSASRRDKGERREDEKGEEEEDDEEGGEREDPSVAVTLKAECRVARRTRRASEPAVTTSTPTTTFKPRPANWSVEEVTAFIHTLPGCSEVAEGFRLQEIDGQALLLLTEEHLMTSMNIKLGPALKICAHINALKNQ